MKCHFWASLKSLEVSQMNGKLEVPFSGQLEVSFSGQLEVSFSGRLEGSDVIWCDVICYGAVLKT